MVVILKLDVTPHCAIDFQKLNAQCLQETHHTASPFQFVSKIPPHTKKTVIDAVGGYHSVALDPKSQPLTTFIRKWGRYMHLHIPQSVISAGDAYTCQYDAITEGVLQKVKIVDDAILYNVSVKDHFFHVSDYLTLCASNGVVDNAPKFQFFKDTVEFAGLTITLNGIIPSAKMLSAISDCPSQLT